MSDSTRRNPGPADEAVPPWGWPPATASGLAGWLREFVLDGVEALLDRHAPDGRLPRVFAGHAVEPDVTADLIYTLGHLHRGGVERIAGTPIDEVLRTQLAGIDGARTHTFFSYRVAETVLQWGPWADNPLLDPLDDDRRANVATACDSSDWIDLLDARILPRNYAAVLARCELARLRLGLIDEPGVVDDLVARVVEVLGGNPAHHLDDSVHGIGRFDIYTADVWLFTEPLADRIGPLWLDGLRTALGLVERTLADDGTAVAWGRSTGSLGAALTVELVASSLRHELGDDSGRWLARGRRAASRLPGWFTDGVVDAHRHRSPYGYRGPFRRLQLTLDLFGKLAWAANELELHRDTTATADTALDTPLDELVRFDDSTTASVWCTRGPGGSVVVPLVGATRSDYLCAPRSPGLFEVPVDSELACWAPVAVVGEHRHTVSGLPARVEHGQGWATAEWDGLRHGAELDAEAGPADLPGTVRATWRRDGRTLHVTWEVELDDTPRALWWSVPERADRPLRVEWRALGGTAGRSDAVLVDGIDEWRSFWSRAHRVHQFDATPARRSQVELRVTPALRVSSSAHGHHYHRSLVDPMADAVVDLPLTWGPLADPEVDRDAVDLFHLHWPEWVAFDDLEAHRRIVEDLQARGIPTVWTAHNLTPHDPTPTGAPQTDYDPVYRLWADHADAIVHHTHGGLKRFVGRYGRGRARHVVIPHGDFSSLWSDRLVERSAAEVALGLPPARIRIGLVGAPRTEKLVGEFLDGVVGCERDDVQVVCWSLRDDEPVPDDPRIAVAEPYRMVDEATYALRLSACDALAFPFDPDGGMQATGTVADAIAAGLPGLCSDWWFLRESLGEAAVPVGHTAGPVAAALDALDDDILEAARMAAVARRDHTRWSDVAARTLTLYEQVLTDHWRVGRISD